MLKSRVRDYCSRNGLTYVYGVVTNAGVFFCTVNNETLMYTMYVMHDDKVEIASDNFDVIVAKFKKEAMLGIGGKLIEDVK